MKFEAITVESCADTFYLSLTRSLAPSFLGSLGCISYVPVRIWASWYILVFRHPAFERWCRYGSGWSGIPCCFSLLRTVKNTSIIYGRGFTIFQQAKLMKANWKYNLYNTYNLIEITVTCNVKNLWAMQLSWNKPKILLGIISVKIKVRKILRLAAIK